jgi:hypothetical protein
VAAEGTKGDGKPEIPALKPDWGKPTVRNLGEAMETSASLEARSAPLPYPTMSEIPVRPAPRAQRTRQGLQMAEFSMENPGP